MQLSLTSGCALPAPHLCCSSADRKLHSCACAARSLPCQQRSFQNMQHTSLHATSSGAEQEAWGSVLTGSQGATSTDSYQHGHKTSTSGEGRQWTSALRTVAVIDCGSHSARLLIRRGDRQLVKQVVDVHLGEGLDNGDRLISSAIQRTVDALLQFRHVMDAHDVQRFQVVTTAAVRQCSNPEDFLSAAEAALGQRPVVLSGENEAQASFRGATCGAQMATLDAAAQCMVIDLGGRSTELVAGWPSSGMVDKAVSLPMGCISLTHAAANRVDAWQAAMQHASETIRNSSLAASLAAECRQIIAVGGTITTAAAICLGQKAYNSDAVDGCQLTTARLQQLAQLSSTSEGRFRLKQDYGWVSEKRLETLAGGISGYLALLALAQPREGVILVRESDLMDGIIQNLQSGL